MDDDLFWCLFAVYMFIRLVLVAIGQSPAERTRDDLSQPD